MRNQTSGWHTVNYWKSIRKIILVAIWKMDWIKQAVAASKEAVVKCQVSYHGGWIDAGKAWKEKKEVDTSVSVPGEYLDVGYQEVRLSWGISKAWLSPTQVSQGPNKWWHHSTLSCVFLQSFSPPMVAMLYFSLQWWLLKYLPVTGWLILGSYQRNLSSARLLLLPLMQEVLP